MGKSAWPPLPYFGGVLGGTVGGVLSDVIGQGAAQQNAYGANMQVAMESALNAYVPTPPSEQWLARAEVDRLREELSRVDWLWWGWVLAGVTAALLKAVT